MRNDYLILNIRFKQTHVFAVCAFLLSDNRIESLIQKADQVLNSLSQSSVRAYSDADESRAQPKKQGFSLIFFLYTL